MSKAELAITAITIECFSQTQAARRYGLPQAWVSRLMVLYRTEGSAPFEPRSQTSRTRLAAAGHDAGPDTIA